ncbi:MAG: thioredoxin domain-containing protein [bacterium]|nr:thioredoxin domain-containing protein [bacterium]
MKNFLVIAILLCGSILLVGCNKKTSISPDGTTTTETVAEGQVEVDLVAANGLAACLTENGVTMYGTERCGHCKNQKAMFGEAFDKVTYVDCDQQRQTCLDAGVRGFPTRIDAQGNTYPGTQPLSKLAEIGTCDWNQ